MTVYMPRSAWTTAPRGGATLVASDLTMFVQHYTGRPRSSAYGVLTQAQEAAVLRAIRDDHMSRGWADIGYQLVYTQAGRVWDARGISRVPAAHASSANPRANWAGGAALWLLAVDEDPSTAMIEAALDCRENVWLDRWPAAVDVIGHGQVPGAATSCPGAPLRGLIRDGVLLGEPGGSPGQPAPPVRDPRPAPGPEQPWPLPPGHYFGPREWGNRSVSGWHGRIFQGRRDSAWLAGWSYQLKARGWPAGRNRRYLRQHGHDGRYGPEYQELIRAFQADQGLTMDGLLGPVTWRAAYRNPVT